MDYFLSFHAQNKKTKKGCGCVGVDGVDGVGGGGCRNKKKLNTMVEAI